MDQETTGKVVTLKAGLRAKHMRVMVVLVEGQSAYLLTDFQSEDGFFPAISEGSKLSCWVGKAKTAIDATQQAEQAYKDYQASLAQSD